MHPEIECFIRRATRGLWGQQRQLVRRELLGAVEDRLWRYQVGGCDEAEAVRRALDDLGSPAVIALGMQRTHTWPRALPWASALILLTAVGVVPLTQSQAQVVASPLNLTALFCDPSAAGALQRTQQLSPQVSRQFEHLRQTHLRAVERLCESMTSDTYELVERDSLIATLQTQGVQVSATPPASWMKTVATLPGHQTWRWLTFPGFSPPVALIPVGSVSQPLVSVYDLVYTVLNTQQLPLRVEGEINPRVTIGRTQFVLGTPQTPVQASQLRTAALARQLDPVLNARSFRGLTNTADPLDQTGFSNTTVTLPVRGPLADGQVVGVLVRLRSGPAATHPENQVPEDLLYTTRVRAGQLTLLQGMNPKTIQIVDSFEALRRPLPVGVDHQVMLMPLANTDDLVNLSYQVMAPATLK